MPEYDVVIVGAGPGGYVSAIRAAQLGLRPALVERAEVGGVCLNWGCIPSKALLHSAEVVSLLKHAEELGISFKELHLDYGKAVDRSRQVVLRLTRGVQGLLRKNHVESVAGEAILRDAHTVEVKESGQRLTSRAIILATGAHPRALPMLQPDGQRVITSREALEQRQVPAAVVIVGGGAIGCEFAYLYNAYGASVTIVELLPHLLPNEDEEISQQLERSFAKQGIQVLTCATVQEARQEGDRVTLRVSSQSQGEQELGCQQVLLAVGIEGTTQGMGLEEAGVQVEKGFVKVDTGMATTAPGVYAIGDVTGQMPLAHVASAQGTLVVERLAGRETPPINYISMPRATYCHPQVASFGLTESQAREQGHQVKVGKFPFMASGKALAMGDTEGMAKLVTDARHGGLLGAHLIGGQVTELLPELSMAHLLEGTAFELGSLVHAHPTLAEAVKEAALAVNGEAIHI